MKKMFSYPAVCLHSTSIVMLVACSLLTQCSVTDPGYERLAANAETNPRKDIIVGMWHLPVANSLLDTKRRCSYMFRSDGTGVGRSTLDDTPPVEEVFQWNYLGDGLWAIRSNLGWAGHLRISGDNLLLHFEHEGAIGQRVFTRVQ